MCVRCRAGIIVMFYSRREMGTVQRTTTDNYTIRLLLSVLIEYIERGGRTLGGVLQPTTSRFRRR